VLYDPTTSKIAYGPNVALGYDYVVSEAGYGDYTDIQSAIDAIGTSKGRIYVRDGFSSNITSTIQFFGDGDSYDEITMVFNPAVTMNFSGAIDGFQIGDATHTVNGIQLFGNYAKVNHVGAGGVDGFHFKKAHHCLLDKFYIGETAGWENAAVHFDLSTWVNWMYNNHIRNSNYLIKLTGAANQEPNHITIADNVMGNSTTAGIDITRSQASEIRHNVIDSNTNAIVDHYSWDTWIVQNYFETNTDYDIKLIGDIAQVESPKIMNNWTILSSGDAFSTFTYLDDVDSAFVGFNTARWSAGAGIFLETTANTTNCIKMGNDNGGQNDTIVAGLVADFQQGGNAYIQSLYMPNAKPVYWKDSGGTYRLSLYLSGADKMTMVSQDNLELLLNASGKYVNMYDSGAGAWVANFSKDYARIDGVLTQNLKLANNRMLQWKDSGGTLRNVLYMGADDGVRLAAMKTGEVTYIGADYNGDVRMGQNNTGNIVFYSTAIPNSMGGQNLGHGAGREWNNLYLLNKIFFKSDSSINLYGSGSKLKTDDSFQANNYYSGDGSQGLTQVWNVGIGDIVTIKDGLIISIV